MRSILATLVMVFIMTTTGSAVWWTGLPEVPDDVGPGGAAVASGDRGYVFAIVGDGNSYIYAYDVSADEWIEDMDYIPCDVIETGAISYESNYGTRLFVVYDDDTEDQDSIAVYQFYQPPSSLEWQGRWLGQRLPLPLNERPMPGLATAFRPDSRSHTLMSGWLYLLWGDGSRSFYRYPLQQVPYVVVDGYAPDSSGYANTTDVILDWTPRVDPGMSQVQLDNSSDFDSPIVDTTTAQSHHRVSSGLSNGTNYYWRARYKIDDSHWTQWSSTWVFQTTITAVTRSPYAFPEDSAILATTRPVFNWTWTSGANCFRIQIDDNSNFISPAVDVEATTDEYRATSDLADGTYYWRTMYRVGLSWSDWGTTRMFKLENGWEDMADATDDISEGAAMCYSEHLGAESLWVLGGGVAKTFYNYYVNTDEWHTVAPTDSNQRWGASIVTGRANAELWANCGAGNNAPFKRDSYVNRYLPSSNSWNSRYKPLPGWDGSPRDTAYCMAGSALAYEPLGASEGYLYLMAAGERRPNFWVRHLTDDDDGGQASSIVPLASPLTVLSDAAGYRVQFLVAKPGLVSARVFDAAGRLARNLDMPEQATGTRTLAWDMTDAAGRRVPTGAYFLTLAQGSARICVKLLAR